MGVTEIGNLRLLKSTDGRLKGVEMKRVLDCRPLELRRVPKDGFDTRAAAVERWYRELPWAHADESLQRLYLALREVNGYRLLISAAIERVTAAAPLQPAELSPATG